MFHGEERTVQCAYCPLTYTDKKGLYQHMHRKHPKDKDGRRTNVGRVCVTPDHSGDSEDSQGIPTIQNVPTYDCPYCNKVLKLSFYCHISSNASFTHLRRFNIAGVHFSRRLVHAQKDKALQCHGVAQVSKMHLNVTSIPSCILAPNPELS